MITESSQSEAEENENKEGPESRPLRSELALSPGTV